MGNLVRKFGYLTAVAVFCFGSSAFANTVTLTFTGTSGSAPLGYAYIYPYYFNISPADPVGSPTNHVAMVCDDFTDEITNGEPPWSVVVTNVPSVASTNTYFFGITNYNGDTGITSYEEAAWLAEQLVSPPPNASVADIQWALWGLFDGSNGVFGSDFLTDFNGFGSSDKTEITKLLADAKTQHGSAASYANVYVYTPAVCSTNGCTPEPSSDTNRPQEFIRVVPEASTSALLGAGLLGLAALML